MSRSSYPSSRPALALGGMLVHHGDWDGRSEMPPQGFWEIVEESGVGNYFLANPPSDRTSGTLADLSSGHRAAFYRAVHLLQKSA